MTFTRITTRPDVWTGKPCIRDQRFPVARLLGLMASGQDRAAILSAYPYLESADIDEALRYAASVAEDEVIVEMRDILGDPEIAALRASLDDLERGRLISNAEAKKHLGI